MIRTSINIKFWLFITVGIRANNDLLGLHAKFPLECRVNHTYFDHLGRGSLKLQRKLTRIPFLCATHVFVKVVQ